MYILKKTLFALLSFLAIKGTEYSIVYVHLGHYVPQYIFTSVAQARSFNPNTKIFVLVNKSNVETFNSNLKNLNIKIVSCESLNITNHHNQFLKKTKLSDIFIYASERFFYLEELMKDYNLTHIFHFESDVLIYCNILDYFSIFKGNYKGIAATFDADDRCIPGFFYINNVKSIEKLNNFFASLSDTNLFDMQLIAKFRNECYEYIDNLPIIPTDYTSFYELKNLIGSKTLHKERYSNHFDKFKSIFDAAAIGQYLGGINPIFKNSKPGFISETCLFNPSYFLYEWHKDKYGRKIPFIKFDNKLYKINNLHIHCKDLKKFCSI